MLEVSNLGFEYPGLRALDDVSFRVEPQEVVALVGPNGAGKSTLLRCLVGLERPLEGEVRLDGQRVEDDPTWVHQRIGYLPDRFGLYSELTLRQSLLYWARAQRVPEPQVADSVAWAAQQVQLEHKLEESVSALSRGMAQRLAIAQVIIHRPQILFLDEPASGLDPEAREHLAELFNGLKAAGLTLIVSSHILAELEAYATRMLILREGRLVEQVATGHALASARHFALKLVEPFEELEATLNGQPGVASVHVQGAEARFTLEGDDEAAHVLLLRLMAAGGRVHGFHEVEARLRDVYRAHASGEDAS